MSRNLQSNELVDIYFLKHKEKLKDADIARKMHRTDWGISLALKNLEKHMAGNTPQQKRKVYVHAAKRIKALLKEETVAPLQQGALQTKPEEAQEKQESLVDPFRKLQEAEAMLIDAVMEIAETRVKHAHEQEMATMKKEYEEKLKHYQELLVAAKDSSMVGVLKKRFGINN